MEKRKKKKGEKGGKKRGKNIKGTGRNGAFSILLPLEQQLWPGREVRPPCPSLLLLSKAVVTPSPRSHLGFLYLSPHHHFSLYNSGLEIPHWRRELQGWPVAPVAPVAPVPPPRSCSRCRRASLSPGSASRTSCPAAPPGSASVKPLPGTNNHKKPPKVLGPVLLPRHFLPGRAVKVTLKAKEMGDSWWEEESGRPSGRRSGCSFTKKDVKSLLKW